MARTQATKIDAELKGVTERPNGKFQFEVVCHDTSTYPTVQQQRYYFFLSPAKAARLENAEGCWPVGSTLGLTGRLSRSYMAQAALWLNHVKVHTVDGWEMQAWVERQNSADALVQDEKEGASSEETLRSSAPAPPAFASPQEAYERAMYIVRMQVKKKTPRLTRQEVWALRDALNMLKSEAGL
jgi:hypothetical protein